MTTLVDGHWSDTLPADDRGFLFGDHVFETMQSTGESVPLWRWHCDRLRESAELIGIDLPLAVQLEEDLDKLMSLGAGMLRLTVTRGSSASGYWVPEHITARRVLQWRPLPSDLSKLRRDGLSVHSAGLQLPPSYISPWSGLKHGNRLAQVMLAESVRRLGCQEALVYRSNGQLCESISSNVIIAKQGDLLTPEHPDVLGVGLRWLRHRGVEIKASEIDVEQVGAADEIILMNAALGPRGVSSVDGQVKKLGPVLAGFLKIWTEVLV